MNRRLLTTAMVLAVALLMDRTALAQERANPQPTADQLQPGLAVGYSIGYVQSLAEIRPPKGHTAPPIAKLDNIGETFDKVLTSDYAEGVAADIVGLIKLDVPGQWKFQVNSNDGVRVSLGGKKILEDDYIHSDQMSEVAEVDVKEPGWYPLHILYFQRKGTYALQLFWQKPGGKQEIVPPEALAHVKT